MPGKAANFANKMRVKFPIRAILPGHMNRTDRMADKKMFRIAATVNEQRFRICTDQFEGLFW